MIVWGTYFPLISEALTGTRGERRAALLQPVHDAAGAAARAADGHRPAARLAAGHAGQHGRSFLVPVGAAAVALVAMLVLTPAAESTTSLIMFTLIAFVLAVVGQEFGRGVRARRVMAGEWPPVALAQLLGRNRRRYGGYVVHAGIALMFLGVAASSAFVEQRDMRLRPGPVHRRRRLPRHLREADRRASSTTRRAPARRSRFGARPRRAPKGDEAFTLPPGAQLLPGRRGRRTAGRRSGATSRARRTARSTRAGASAATSGSPSSPTSRALNQPIEEANRRFGDLPGDAQALIIAALVERYRNDSPPANFRAIDSPMITWIWIGGGVIILGALLALWPTPRHAGGGPRACRGAARPRAVAGLSGCRRGDAWPPTHAAAVAIAVDGVRPRPARPRRPWSPRSWPSRSDATRPRPTPPRRTGRCRARAA